MEFTTQNTNKSVLIEAASFKDAVNLKKSTMKCLTGVSKDLDFSNLTDIDVSKFFDTLAQLIINLDTSEEFETAVFECLKCCIYDYNERNIKITRQLFDDIPELREDYYEIVTKCCEVNLRPFFKSLSTELSTRFKTIKPSDQQ